MERFVCPSRASAAMGFLRSWVLLLSGSPQTLVGRKWTCDQRSFLYNDWMKKIDIENWISLKSPTGKLWMRRYEDGEWEAWFEGVAKDEWIELVADQLLQKVRFAGQLKCGRDWTVLHHSYCMAAWCWWKGLPDEIAKQCLYHDFGEASWIDVPKPFKTEEDEKREEAIIKAMPFDLKNLDPMVKKIDAISLAAEGAKFGYRGPAWEWMYNYATKEEMTDFVKHTINEVKFLNDRTLKSKFVNECHEYGIIPQ